MASVWLGGVCGGRWSRRAWAYVGMGLCVCGRGFVRMWSFFVFFNY